MSDLKDDLMILRDLNDIRDCAKKLRERGLHSLKRIKNITENKEERRWEPSPKLPENWIFSGDKVEVSLLVKVKNYQNMSESDEVNDYADANTALIDGLKGISLKQLLPLLNADTQDRDATVPVLVAARVLQALTTRPETVFSKASMLCYYRIIRELYSAAPPDSPDWIIGAARSGKGGRTSAFITSECIRAVFAFEKAIKRTSEYFDHTLALHDRYSELNKMIESLKIKPDSNHPLSNWANKEIERACLDWYISTNPRNGAIALYCEDDKNCKDNKNGDLLCRPNPIERQDILDQVKNAFNSLQGRILNAVRKARCDIAKAHREIRKYRKDEKVEWEKEQKKIKEHSYLEKQLPEDAHNTALYVIKNIRLNAIRCYMKCKKESDPKKLLKYLRNEFESFPGDIHQVLEPTKRYVRTVLDRELATARSDKMFDAGEMIFAATAYGTAIKWEPNEKLTQACDCLVKVLPENGRFVTNQPFHATEHGYKLLPIGCEMTRHFAKLIHRTGYEFKPQMAKKMLNIFTGEQCKPSKDNKHVGWNFENAPDVNKPYVWVTAISVQALDRIVRMLNDRINEMVFKHFKVIKPEDPHTDLTLNNIIYPDHWLMNVHYEKDKEKKSIAIRLEQMRAHVTHVSLPYEYNEKVFSAILYGPPGTGKTSLLEAVAQSSGTPLVMLSPSDLIVQGREQLERRARDVFEALSMLSQTVILFDEFEPILRRRREPETGKVDQQGNTKDFVEAVEGLSKVEKAIMEGGGSMLRFLLTGMLPKLISLHDAAEKQSLVYCLATNHLEEIDKAAKRGGRFDVEQPIYNPDPISRAGTFLINLQTVDKNLNGVWSNLNKPHAFAEIVVYTANESAGALYRRFLQPQKLENGKRGWLFTYVLEEDTELKGKLTKRREENFKKMQDHKEEKSLLDEDMQNREWLYLFEQRLKSRTNGFDVKRQPEYFLEYLLTYDNAEIRRRYSARTATISEFNSQGIKQGIPAQERARKAWDIRSNARLQARSIMAAPEEVELLRARNKAIYNDPDGPTFDSLVENHERDGLTGDAVYEAIINGSYRAESELEIHFEKLEMTWAKTSNPDFLYETEAEINKDRFVIRLNDFPDESLYTLLKEDIIWVEDEKVVRYEEVGNFNDWPKLWSRRQ